MNRTKKNSIRLLPDFCPQINVEMKFGKGGVILHNNKICVAKPLNKMFNSKSRKKKTYLVKEHSVNKEALESITFFAITTKEFNEKRNKFKKSK